MNRFLNRLAKRADRRPIEVNTPIGRLGFDPEQGPYGDATLVRAFKEASVAGEQIDFAGGVRVTAYSPTDEARRRPENAYAAVLLAAANCGVAADDVVVTTAPLSVAVFEQKIARLAAAR